jgi:hypothetical protein
MPGQHLERDASVCCLLPSAELAIRRVMERLGQGATRMGGTGEAPRHRGIVDFHFFAADMQ